MNTLSLNLPVQWGGEQFNVSDEGCYIKCARTHVRLEFENIVFIEARANYVRFHTPDGSHMTILTMKRLMERLPTDQFLRANRSTIINKSWIASFDSSTVTLKNGKQFSFGEGIWREFVSQINVI